ncbi:MAG: hypothetical protein M0T83_09335 [Nitrospiraceae bacterium]|nr:hypothetical protein [Nitrospiraceae bacterium]
MAYLVKNGVPFDVACSMEDEDLVAWEIAFGELDGGTFNWSRMQFEEPT